MKKNKLYVFATIFFFTFSLPLSYLLGLPSGLFTLAKLFNTPGILLLVFIKYAMSIDALRHWPLPIQSEMAEVGAEKSLLLISILNTVFYFVLWWVLQSKNKILKVAVFAFSILLLGFLALMYLGMQGIGAS